MELWGKDFFRENVYSATFFPLFRFHWQVSSRNKVVLLFGGSQMKNFREKNLILMQCNDFDILRPNRNFSSLFPNSFEGFRKINYIMNTFLQRNSHFLSFLHKSNVSNKALTSFMYEIVLLFDSFSCGRQNK